MDPVLKDLLEQNLKLAQENNDLLRSMRRRSQWGLIGQVIFWALFVIAPLIFLWGYLGPLMSALGGGDATTFSPGNLQNLLQQYEAQQAK